MRKCSLCGADTILLEDGVPICVACANAEDQKPKPQAKETGHLSGPGRGDAVAQLQGDLLAARKHLDAAVACFEEVTRSLPSEAADSEAD